MQIRSHTKDSKQMRSHTKEYSTLGFDVNFCRGTVILEKIHGSQKLKVKKRN